MADLLPHPLSGLFTESRARVIDVLLSSQQPLSGRDVAVRADMSPTTATKALEGLYEAGLVLVAPRGRALLWRLAEDHHLVRLLREWSEGVDDEARALIEGVLGEKPVAAVLFGSTARAEDHLGSDVEVLLVAADDVRARRYRERSAELAHRLKLLLGRRVDVVVMRADDLRERSHTSFVRGLVRDGRTLTGTAVTDLVA